MQNQIYLLIQETLLEIQEITNMESYEDCLSIEMKGGEIHVFCFEESTSEVYQKVRLAKSCISWRNL